MSMIVRLVCGIVVVGPFAIEARGSTNSCWVGPAASISYGSVDEGDRIETIQQILPQPEPQPQPHRDSAVSARTLKSITLISENDSWRHTDRYYTNGFRITVTNPFIDGDDADAVRETVLFWLDSTARTRLRPSIVFSLAQEIYTPQNIVNPFILVDDRPYAAWFFVASTLEMEQREQSVQHHEVGIDIGIVGPTAIGREIQNWWHRDIISIDTAAGWANQLHSEVGFNLRYRGLARLVEFKWNDIGSGFELSTSYGASIGNVNTYASGGVGMRLGYFANNGFGPRGKVEQSSVLPRGGTRPTFEIFAFGGIEGRLVVRNIFLDGNTFRDSHNVNSDPMIAELNAGVFLRTCLLSLTVQYIAKSREFQQQLDTQQLLQFAVGVSW